MKHARNKLFLWMLIVMIMLSSLTGCASSKEVIYLPEKYKGWSVASASVNLRGSDVVSSSIIVTLEGNSILLEYHNGQLKESQSISQKTTQLSGREFVEFLESSAKELREITQSDTVLIGITGDTNLFASFGSKDLVHVYETSTGKMKSGFYDGGGAIAWGSIMDGGYERVSKFIIR